MNMVRSVTDSADQRWSAIEHACRGVVGDRLRSVSVDAPEHSATLYRRSDLPPGADAPVHEAMAAGASCQSPVFADGGRPSPPSATPDDDRSSPPAAESDDDRPSPPAVESDDDRLSSSDATGGSRTVCEFDAGYVTRIQVGDTSVVATTDGIKMDRDTELSAAMWGVLGE